MCRINCITNIIKFNNLVTLEVYSLRIIKKFTNLDCRFDNQGYHLILTKLHAY
jgi:hypothetical protein